MVKGHNWWCVMFPPLCFYRCYQRSSRGRKSKEELDEVIEKEKKKF